MHPASPHGPPDGPSGTRARTAARRVGVSVVGGVVLLAGLALLFLPGPGMLVVLAGLAILATEYAWARRGYGWARRRAARAIDGARDAVAGRHDRTP